MRRWIFGLVSAAVVSTSLSPAAQAKAHQTVGVVVGVGFEADPRFEKDCQAGLSLMSRSDRVAAEQDMQALIESYASAQVVQDERAQVSLFARRRGVSWKTPEGDKDVAAVNAKYRKSPQAANATSQAQIGPHFLQIANDSQSAKGLWYAPPARPDPKQAIRPRDDVVLLGAALSKLEVRYAADFVFEHGQWKIWHLQVFQPGAGSSVPQPQPYCHFDKATSY